jgi:phosphoribosylamine--glycine ligase
MASSQDHKRVFDNDKGPNTGGMGAYSPAPVVTKEVKERVLKEIMQPTIDAMRKEGREYKGILYAGLMIGKDGPKVVEFNCRFGDPETQAILPRLESDLLPILLACIDGSLTEQEIKWSQKACCCVAMASGGYPGQYEKGKEIFGLEEAAKLPETVVFHAGTKTENGKILTSGGRVLGVTALGGSIKESIENAYKAVQKISFEGTHFRKDIGQKALERKSA